MRWLRYDINVILTVIIIMILVLTMYLYIRKLSVISLPDAYPTWSLDSLPTNGRIVLWIIHGYPPGLNAGSEFMAHAMNRELIKRGFTVVVACQRYPQIVFEGVYIMDLRRHADISRIASMSSVIMTHHGNARLACKIAAEHVLPVIEVVHNTVTPITYPRFPDSNLYHVYNSEWLRKFYAQRAQDYERSIVVRPPVNPADYDTGSDAEAAAKRKYITLINVNEEKGGHILVELARAMPKVQFMGIKGAYGKQVVEGSPPPNLHYEENTLDIKNVYARTKILIMPSIIETWGRTAVEAMSSGIPVIANPTDGLVECTGHAGIFAKRGRTAEWVSTINQLLQDDAHYTAASAAARERAGELNPEIDLQRFYEFVDAVSRRN